MQVFLSAKPADKQRLFRELVDASNEWQQKVLRGEMKASETNLTLAKARAKELNFVRADPAYAKLLGTRARRNGAGK